MIPPSAEQPPIQATIIRRAEINDIETVCDAVWKLTEGSATAAQWSRAAFYPYAAAELASGALQVKAIFVACVPEAGQTSTQISRGHTNSRLGQIVGFAAFSAITGIGAGESTLENMVVASAWQKHGLGRRLLAAGMMWCRAQAARSVFLEVRETNRPAIALYERAGFSVVGRRSVYYRDPVEDALQMQKILGPAARRG